MEVGVTGADQCGASSVAFSVGASDVAMVRLEFSVRMHEGASDYWDGNWLFTQMSGVVGGFRFDLPAHLHADEIRNFREGLGRVSEQRSGEARLSSVEDWIDLLVTCDGTGLEVTGFVAGKPGRRNRLHFVIENCEISLLPALLAELAAVEYRFPVLMAPEN